MFEPPDYTLTHPLTYNPHRFPDKKHCNSALNIWSLTFYGILIYNRFQLKLSSSLAETGPCHQNLYFKVNMNMNSNSKYSFLKPASRKNQGRLSKKIHPAPPRLKKIAI
jgi:hypothetical protein